ncbi:MAG: GNAT family N-acetyltransferase [Pseudomonadota bacterium]
MPGANDLPLLVLPRPEFEQSYRAYIAELGDEERYPFPLDFEHNNFPALLRRLEDLANGVDLPAGFVPSSTFWLIEDREIVGVSNLRHSLNESLRKYGGHIGLGIRPTRRGRGLGRTLLALTLGEARKRGIEAVHIHCYKDNQASARMIISNGGVLDSEIKTGERARIVQRYVVSAT